MVCSPKGSACCWHGPGSAAHVVVPSLIQISTLKPHCSNLLVETFMPAINGKVTWMAVMLGALGVLGQEGRGSSVSVSVWVGLGEVQEVLEPLKP